MQVHGGIGYSRHKPFEHIYRHHRRYRITEGSEEIQMRKVGAYLFGTAADSVIMVIDAAKGVEPQTRKLFEACRLRSIPVFTFMNKMDRENRDPFDLMDEVEQVLGIEASPLNWPVGGAEKFQGVVDRRDRKMHLYTRTSPGGAMRPDVQTYDLDTVEPEGRLPPELLGSLRSEIHLLDEAGNAFTEERFREGRVTPVFWGSALLSFGVEPLFDAFVDLAPSPSARMADGPEGEVRIDPIDHPFSAYVFKMQANMNPKHRDCVAFMRINSGRFDRDMVVRHNRSGRQVRLSRPHSLMADERNTLEKAFPGDVIGVMNPGNLAIGDTLSIEAGFDFKPLPQFQPELFARIQPTEMKNRKSLDRGIEQLVLEGAVQILHDWNDGGGFPFVAAVGRLQFDVLQYRLKDEYGVTANLSPMPYRCSAWLEGDPGSFKLPSTALLARDRLGRPMVLFSSEWEKGYAAKQNPDHRLIDFA
jgi:peptide chain release factor 3